MKKLFGRFWLVFVLALPLLAGSMVTILLYVTSGTGAPAGACANNTLYTQLDAAAGQYLWACVSGTWQRVGATTAVEVINTPNGTISATTVQGAVNELDSEKEPTLTAGGVVGKFSGTPTGLLLLRDDGVLAFPVAYFTSGTSLTLTAPSGYGICTGTCTVVVPVPVAGYEFCVLNDNNVATAITLSALGSSARYENSARTAYGTAGTGTLVVAAAAKNKVCILGRDSTHYLTVAYEGGAVTVN